MDNVKEGIQPALQTRNDLPLAISTSWHGMFGTFVPNLTEPMNFILTAVHGLWRQEVADMSGYCPCASHLGRRMGEWCYSYIHSFFPLALDGGQWPSLALGRFTPWKTPSWTPTNQPTNQPGSLTPCSAVPYPVWQFPACYWSWRLFTVFTAVHNWSLSSAKWIHNLTTFLLDPF